MKKMIGTLVVGLVVATLSFTAFGSNGENAASSAANCCASGAACGCGCAGDPAACVCPSGCAAGGCASHCSASGHCGR